MSCLKVSLYYIRYYNNIERKRVYIYKRVHNTYKLI